MKRSVSVTGLGVVSSIGNNTDDFWNSCLSNRSVIESIPNKWNEYFSPKSQCWVPLLLPDYKNYGFKNSELLQYDPTTLNALIATDQAISSSGIPIKSSQRKAGTYEIEDIEKERIGIFMGSGSGGVSSTVSSFSTNALGGLKNKLKGLLEAKQLNNDDIDKLFTEALISEKFNPFTVPKSMINALAAAIGIKYSALGPVRLYPYACASGTHAIGEAYKAVTSGEVDIAICGGSEYLDDFCGTAFRGFDVANTLAKSSHELSQTNRPFDRNRSGFVFSQGGAGVLVLEERDRALARDANIYADIINFNCSFDAHNMMSGKPDGAEVKRMLKDLLIGSSIPSDQVDYVNAHGTGTVQNDELEAKSIEEVLGNRPWVNSSKSILGHTIGASGALEAIVTVLSIKNQTTHISKNLENPIRELNFVLDLGKKSIDTAISQSFAFGGHNAALLFQTS